jgi:hypothetical protein
MKRPSTGALLVSAATIALSLTLAGLRGPTLDPHTLPPCPTEDGGPVTPCVWDSDTQGNRGHGPGVVPVLVYVTGACPVLPDGAACVRDDG